MGGAWESGANVCTCPRAVGLLLTSIWITWPWLLALPVGLLHGNQGFDSLLENLLWDLSLSDSASIFSLGKHHVTLSEERLLGFTICPFLLLWNL